MVHKVMTSYPPQWHPHLLSVTMVAREHLEAGLTVVAEQARDEAEEAAGLDHKQLSVVGIQ